MKMGSNVFRIIATMLALVVLNNNAVAQQYKIRQVMSVMEMKSESTIYVKGMRKRTEGGGYAGMPNNLITIEQCDLQRTITLNDKKKLYYIEPFSKETATVINEDEKPATKNNTVATPAKAAIKKGGIVTMWYNITDTGERKKMYGLTARHVWSTQKIKPSPDACMKDSMLMKTDGWYIDLPEFKCPVRYAVSNTAAMAGTDCIDKYVTRLSGKGKLGFPLIEKRTMIMGKGAGETTQFETSLETLEFSTATLDPKLFDVPAGYTLVKNLTELQDKMDAAAMAKLYEKTNKEENSKPLNNPTTKKAGVLRIGVLEPGIVEDLHAPGLHAYLVSTLIGSKVEAVAVASAEEAKKNGCDYLLTSKITQVKGGSKAKGILKAVTNVGSSGASSYTIEAQLLLSNLSDGSTRSEKNVSGKFEGTADGATKKALEEGSRLLLRELN
ncbi:MAG TPA: hypothetical protein VNA26_07710 [Chitinophagaceae bacterium]|nr:hypothetical protein [Chitinophagaceae bacterium]